MAHSILRGSLGITETNIWDGDDWPTPTEEWEIGDINVAAWLAQFFGNPRTVAILSGRALEGVLQGDIWATETDIGYSEVTPGSAETIRVGGHDLRTYFARIGERAEVVLIVLDPELGGDISDVLSELAGFPVAMPSEEI